MRRIFALFGIAATLGISGVASAARDVPGALPRLESSSVIVVDQEQGQAIYAKNTLAVQPIASITKLRTAVVVLDARLPLDEQLDKTLDKIREALRLIDARATPDEARAYRKLCLEVALASARASGNGVFGIGAKVSPQEKAYIRRVEALLA